MKGIPDIPELRGFEVPTKVDELEGVIRKLPKDVHAAAMQERPLIMWNRHTKQVALARPSDDGSWKVEIFSVRPPRRQFRP